VVPWKEYVARKIASVALPAILLCLTTLDAASPPADAQQPIDVHRSGCGFTYGQSASGVEIRPAINTSGQVAGPSTATNGDVHAFRTNADLTARQDLGTLGGTSATPSG